MAFGDVRGTLTGTNASIPASFAATGSVSVSVGDLIVVVIAERAANTSTAVTDSLGNTYTQQNSGTVSGNIGAHAFWSRATNAGTLTSVTATCTASGADGAIGAVVFEGPFVSSPLDASPANAVDNTSPYLGPASGTLAQADELVAGWWCGANGMATAALGGGWTVRTNPNTGTGNNTVGAAIGSITVAATTSVQPSWTAGTAPAANALGTMSFKKDTTTPPPASDTHRMFALFD